MEPMPKMLCHWPVTALALLWKCSETARKEIGYQMVSFSDARKRSWCETALFHSSLSCFFFFFFFFFFWKFGATLIEELSVALAAQLMGRHFHGTAPDNWQIGCLELVNSPVSHIVKSGATFEWITVEWVASIAVAVAVKRVDSFD